MELDPQTFVILKQEQALAIFNQAREEMRFYRNLEWQITYYTVLAYAALVVAPLGVPRGRWRNRVSWFAILLVVLAALQAARTLYYSNDIRVTEHARLIEITKIEHLPLIQGIYAKLRPTEPLHRDSWVRIFQWPFDLLGGDGPRPRFPRGLLAVVVLGATFAIFIILLGVPSGRRFFAWVFRWVRRFFARVSHWVRRFLRWVAHRVPRALVWLSQRVRLFFRWMFHWVQRVFAWASHWMPRILARGSQGVQRVRARAFR
jgi:hypothetical protein